MLNTLEKEEMIKIITEFRESVNLEFIDLEDSEIDYGIIYSHGENNNYKIEIVDENGGYEGDGERMDFTLKITRKSDNTYGYLTFYGYYDSWNDCYYHTIKRTTPIEKTVIVYVG